MSMLESRNTQDNSDLLTVESPYIHTEIPGPNARRLIEEDHEWVSHSYIKEYGLVVHRGRGAVIEDVDGNRYLDFMGGVGVATLGHSPPQVVEAIKAQADRFLHICGTDFYYSSFSRLAKVLAELAPGPSKKMVYFGNSGTEVVEAAIKLSRHYTRRPHLLAFHGAFHGRTMGSLTLTSSKVGQRRGFAPFLPSVHHVPYAYCYRCPYGKTYPSCDVYCADVIEKTLLNSTVPPDEIAAIFVEPIQGEGGYVVPPVEFHQKLRAMCDRHGILLVADEVQSGMGRTGKMFAMEHYGVEPDITLSAKGISSGMPIGAMIAKADLMTWNRGSHGSTFGGNPVSCEAALATITALRDGALEEGAKAGERLGQHLMRLKEKHPLIGDVRGKGLMQGMELVRDPLSREPADAECDQVIQRAFQEGVLLLPCGESVIRFSPPLVITPEQIDRGMAILDKVFTEVEKSMG
jgi:4-aminobutyrate aminotransferase